jgi:acid phosphatase family membrane protein YuiD
MNWILVFSVLAWALAQVIKVFVMLIQIRKLDFRYLVSSGGMPSSHSAVVCACAAAIGATQGWTSPIFALAAVTAFVVMYDAANVRKAAGEQAKILNYMMEHWGQMPPEIFSKELKELLGHTPVQVFMGALLGIAVSVFGSYLFC